MRAVARGAAGVAFTLCLCVAGARGEAKPSKKPVLHHMEGKLTSLDTKKKLFRIANVYDQEWPFEITKETEVNMDGKKAKLADLKKGNYLVIHYHFEVQPYTLKRMADRIVKKTGAKPPKKPDPFRMEGKIKTLDAKKKLLMISNEYDQEREFEIGKATEVYVKGKKATLADLKKGDNLLILYHNEMREGSGGGRW